MPAPIKLSFTSAMLSKLPEKIITDGSCTTVKNPDIFFPEDGVDYAEAREVCSGCPLVAICLEYAMANENDGFWGGTTPEERLAINLEPVISPEVRREAAEVRAVISSTMTVAQMAHKLDVTERTVYRYKKKLREELEIESPTWIFSTSLTAAFVQALNNSADDAVFDHESSDSFDDNDGSGLSQTA